MAWLIRTFRIPASESGMALVLALCALTMSIMTAALVWQAQVIADQRQTIQWLKEVKLGG